LDALLFFSGMLTAGSLLWILAGLAVCFALGIGVALFFGSIFYGTSRLARAAEARWDPPQPPGSAR
jgi:hypothetical protein